MEKKEIFKKRGNALIREEKELKGKTLAFIKDAMEELKDVHIFDNFDKEDGSFIYDEEYNCEGINEITDTAPIISVSECMTSEDMYLVGVRYQENKDDVRYPYTIWLDCVPYDDISYVKFIRMEDAFSEYYPTILQFITENI